MTRTSRVEWQKRIERWRQSGLSLREFAATIGVNANTLSYWRYQLETVARRAPQADGDAAPAMRFVELPACAVMAAEYEPVEVVLPSGVRMRVPSRFDPSAVRDLLHVLEER